MEKTGGVGGGRLRRLAARYRSRLYAALGGGVFWLLAWSGAQLPPDWLVVAASAVAPLVLAALVPRYAGLVVRMEDAINQKLALITPARLVRSFLYIPVVAGFLLIASYGSGASVDPVGFLALLGAVNGLHGVAVTLAYHGHGDRISNSILAFSGGLWLLGLVLLHSGLWPLAFALDVVFIIHISAGLLSDLRSRFYPRSGVGVFFGSFNPVHRMHLQILKELLERRSLEKIYVHATTVPKLHRTAVAKGEIEVSQRAGVREYRKTKFSDPDKNYFPTGSWFYEYELRLELLRAAIRDAGLQDRVEVLNLPDIYERSGFFGVLGYVRSRHRGQPIHGLHGSDAGGMWVRNIFDDSGWIYPCPVVRTGNVSATAIRQGAIGLTSITVEEFLAARRTGNDFIFPSGYVFRNC
jgi:hypothetical protein